MPSKHSKKTGTQHHFTYAEKKMCGYGTQSQRLGTESQTPFGYCCLSLNPVVDAVVSPSGHLYSREAILEYLLLKTKGIKLQQAEYEFQMSCRREEENLKDRADEKLQITNFTESQDVGGITKRKSTEIESKQSYMESRKKKFDDTCPTLKKEQLKKVSPWIVDFTPSAKKSEVAEPAKRPSSPFSGRPLRTKDLIPVNLVRESAENAGAVGLVRFICPVSRKTITNQKTFLIVKTGTLMTEAAYLELAVPFMTCPLTSEPFKESDVLELVSAASAFAASGEVIAKAHTHTLN